MRFPIFFNNDTTRATSLLLCGLALVACDPKILLGEFGDTEAITQGGSEGGGEGGSEGQSSTGGEQEATGGSEGPGSGDTAIGSSTGGATGDPGTTGDPEPAACDPWEQDCPSGQKCAPYTTFQGPTYDAWRCVDLEPVTQPVGSSCHVTGDIGSGEDDCELGALCWDPDPVTLEGECIALCTGSIQAPSCDVGTHCAVLNDGVLAVCLHDCDPLVQDCADGQSCIQHPGEPETFLCVLDASGAEGQAFDSCEFINACDPGLQCVPGQPASECDPMAPGCCTPFCDTSVPDTCPGDGQVCLPLFEENQAPPGRENVGLCGLEP